MLTYPEVTCWQNFSIVESPDPFGAGAYNFQSISAVRRNRVWLRETTSLLDRELKKSSKLCQILQIYIYIFYEIPVWCFACKSDCF